MKFNREFFRNQYFQIGVKVLAGILIIAFSGFLVNIASIVIGLVLLAMGIYEIVDYFTYVQHKTPNKLLLIKPAVMAVAGLLFAAIPGFFAHLIAFAIGVFLFAVGFSKFQSYIRFSSNKSVWWWATVIVSFITMMIGVVFFFYPKDSINSILVICGIGLIVSAIQDILDKVNKSKGNMY